MARGGLLSFHGIGATALLALALALLAGLQAGFAAEGYWKYEGLQMNPTNDYYAAIKPLPGHVHYLRARPGFQPGPGVARGLIDLYFKTDDADLVVYIATSTLTFSANTQLAILVPDQKVVFELGLAIGANDKAAAMPATGTGYIGIDYGESVRVETVYNQPLSAKGEAVIPGGGPGGTMTIHVVSHLGQLGAMSQDLNLNYVWVAGAPPPAGADAAASKFGHVLGSTLAVMEIAGDSIYEGTWTRRPGTDVFDAVWGGNVRDVIEIESLSGNKVVLYRHGNKGRYTCEVSADGLRVISGTASWYAAGWTWSATISSGYLR